MEVLTKHCRVCAKPLARFKVSYRCADRSEALGKSFGLSVKEDNPDVQPPSFCHSCYNVLVRSQKAKEENECTLPLCSSLLGVHTQSIVVVCVITSREHQVVGVRESKRLVVHQPPAHTRPSRTCML